MKIRSEPLCRQLFRSGSTKYFPQDYREVKRNNEISVGDKKKEPDVVIFCPPDPDPTCSNIFIKLFSS